MTNNLTEAREAIKKLGLVADAVLDQCKPPRFMILSPYLCEPGVTIFNRSNMKISDFTSEVEAFVMNKNEDKLTSNSVDRFEIEILSKVCVSCCFSCEHL